MKLLIIDIDWIVGKTNRLRNFDIDWPRYPSIGLDYRLDWIGLASLLEGYDLSEFYCMTLSGKLSSQNIAKPEYHTHAREVLY